VELVRLLAILLFNFITETESACTFLGPSRKRGPPKGYIDAIEARLHQTEALLGIMLATKDGRAKSLLDDIAQVSQLSHLSRAIGVCLRS
jgi:hypothetical protein